MQLPFLPLHNGEPDTSNWNKKKKREKPTNDLWPPSVHKPRSATTKLSTLGYVRVKKTSFKQHEVNEENKKKRKRVSFERAQLKPLKEKKNKKKGSDF